MLQINDLDEGLELFKTLGSDARMRIIQLLAEKGRMNINELAIALGLTNGAMTTHIKRLEDSDLIETSLEYTGHGNQKICRLKNNHLLLSVRKPQEAGEVKKSYSANVKIGHYCACEISPPCGMAGAYSQIGEENRPAVFQTPEHEHAEILWFQEGYIEYQMPNRIPKGQNANMLTIYFELSSGSHGTGPSHQAKMELALNGHMLGSWLTLEEVGNAKGIYTPRWFWDYDRQFGRIKMLVINNQGTFMDGIWISAATIQQLQLDESSQIRFRITVKPDDTYREGIVLYGSGFGNYNQDISMILQYE